MIQALEVTSLFRNHLSSYLNEHLVSIVLSSFIEPRYDIEKVGRRLNLNRNQIQEILSHAHIELLDDKYIPDEGIAYFLDREVGKIKRYFEHSITNYASLSDKEQRIFDAFLKRYGKRGRQIKKWDDLRIEAIRNDCDEELRGRSTLTFYDGKYICYEELTSSDNVKSYSLFYQIRCTLMYNIKNIRQWINFRQAVNTTITYILSHHFHIFTTDDSNSILTADISFKCNLPRNAKHYISAA